jgi:DNA replication protein DnaC
MDRDFTGDPKLLKRYTEIVTQLSAAYRSGASICFAGAHGLGKSMVLTCILKQASLKGYTCLYTTLSDIVAVLLGPDGEDRYAARRELMSVDFLVIDEFDSRFMQTENASDLFGRTLESIFRTRSQNKLPTLMATNSPNIVESFTGPIKQSIDSLMKGYVKTVIVLGEDFRKAKKP